MIKPTKTACSDCIHRGLCKLEASHAESLSELMVVDSKVTDDFFYELEMTCRHFLEAGLAAYAKTSWPCGQ